MAKNAKKKKAASHGPGPIALPLIREFPPDQVGVSSNNFAVQSDGSDFHLMFFQTQPPMIIASTEEERREQLKKLRDAGGVRSVCLARIVVAADRLPSFIAVMQEGLANHNAAKRNGDDSGS